MQPRRLKSAAPKTEAAHFSARGFEGLSAVPVAIVRGYDYPKGRGKATDMVRPAERDLFR